MIDIDALARHILASRRIRGKIVILCEGEILPTRPTGTARSPRWYRQLDRLPDSSFYKNCIPRSWRMRSIPRPCFFNCGGRSQVLATRERLLALHREAPEQSYLSPDRLFALIDRDLQPESLPAGSPAADTEALWHALYDDNAPIAPEHRIWVTHLIHKEAYFLQTNVAHLLTEHIPPAHFAQKPFTLEAIWTAALQSIRQQPPHPDQDLSAHADIAQHRLAHADVTTQAEPHAIASALEALRDAEEPQADFECALWSVTKAKPHWLTVAPPSHSDGQLSPEQYRDILARNIASEIAARAPSEHPIAAFFDWLQRTFYQPQTTFVRRRLAPG